MNLAELSGDAFDNENGATKEQKIKTNTRSRLQLAKIFDDERKLLLIETGTQSIEQLLKEETDKVGTDIKSKRAKLEELKQKNSQSANSIRKTNDEALTLEDEINKIALEMVTIGLHESRVISQLSEKKKEYEDVKHEYEKKKSKAEEETANLKYKENQLATMKANLKEEQDKLEATNKRNNAIIEEILNTYKQSLMVQESVQDEDLKNKILTQKFTQETAH